MQAASTHGFNLCGIALHREKLHLFASGLGQVADESISHLGIDRRVFDRRVSKNQGVRVNQFTGAAWRVGYQVAIGVLEAGIHRLGSAQSSNKTDGKSEWFEGHDETSTRRVGETVNVGIDRDKNVTELSVQTPSRRWNGKRTQLNIALLDGLRTLSTLSQK